MMGLQKKWIKVLGFFFPFHHFYDGVNIREITKLSEGKYSKVYIAKHIHKNENVVKVITEKKL